MKYHANISFPGLYNIFLNFRSDKVNYLTQLIVKKLDQSYRFNNNSAKNFCDENASILFLCNDKTEHQYTFEIVFTNYSNSSIL